MSRLAGLPAVERLEGYRARTFSPYEVIADIIGAQQVCHVEFFMRGAVRIPEQHEGNTTKLPQFADTGPSR